MGFELDRVVSDLKHCGPFICAICKSLCSLDALVTPGSNPFCRSCFEVWMSKRIQEGLPCRCPVSREDLERPEAIEGQTIELDGKHLAAWPLELAQPLAFRCLKSVQVKCGEGDSYWVGDYGDLEKHLAERNITSVRTPGTTPATSGVVPQPQFTYDDARAAATTRGDVTGAHHGRTLPLHAQPKGQVEVNELDLQHAMERCDKLKKQANAKFNRGDVEGARMLYSEGLALISAFPPQNDDVRTMTASLYSNRAVTFFRERILAPSIEDCDRSLELDPKSEKTYIRKWRALSALGDTEASIQCLRDGTKALPQSSKLAEELRKATGAPGTPSQQRDIMDMSFAGMSRLADDQTRAHEMDLSVAGDPNPTLMERAERLKKQANAKFNKGDIESSRSLYADAIGCIPQPHEAYSQGVKSLLSMLYSNRAVTYFRDKKYQESLDDCEKSIILDPQSEKSYIRKARALGGMDMHDEARACLEDASAKIPTSKKIREELIKAIQESRPDSFRGTDAMTAADSVDFNGSVTSFNFGSMEAKAKGTSGNTRYAEKLELADKLKRNANAKFNRGDIAGARLLYTEALACLPNDREHEEVRACLASLYANRAVTYFREKEYGPSTWDCDKAIELDPISEKSYIRKARALSALERFAEAVACIEVGLQAVGSSGRLQEELDKARELLHEKSPELVEADKPTDPANDFQFSHSAFDYSSSNAFLVSPYSSKPTLDAVSEVKSHEFSLPHGSNEDLERAEKLKKQANAKLNKGDVAGARILYGEGLACLPPKGPETAEGRELAASLYANRAVTFFREKKFSATVLDCDKSLELDPKHEKSFIRKWRALMALGNFEDAFKCLQTAVAEIPDSKRLTEELNSATEQKDLLTTVDALLERREYQEARDTLKPVVKTSDNVSLWLAAARADACLGLTDSALERVNKVLLFNPRHAEGLQVRGYALFLSGEMENGITLLKEALEVEIEHDHKEVSVMLEYCERCFSSFCKGQARVKRGRYEEAVELFTSAVEDGQPLPPDAPLYGLVLTERAEANLLSNQYEDALEDCSEAIRLKNDNMTAWTVKVEVYFALGRLQEARDELAEVRKTWGAGNDTIEEAYKKTDFELRLKKADDDLHHIMIAVESGTPPTVRDGEPLHMNHDARGMVAASGHSVLSPRSKKGSVIPKNSKRGNRSTKKASRE